MSDKSEHLDCLKEQVEAFKRSSSLKDLHLIYHHALKLLLSDTGRLKFLHPIDKERLTKHDAGPVAFKDTIVGYPLSPLYSSIANFLAILTLRGTCPIFDQPQFRTLHEYDNSGFRHDRLREIIDLVLPIPDMIQIWTPQRFLIRLELVLKTLRRRGMIDFLQMRKTLRSRDEFPFTREDITSSSAEPHFVSYNPADSLTKAGRAVAKHAVRDSTKAWWGECSGTAADKNKRGQDLLLRVLDGAAWINMHALPGELSTLEVRTEQGYGLRCLTDPLSFRGFLEPYTEEGWMNKYRH